MSKLSGSIYLVRRHFAQAHFVPNPNCHKFWKEDILPKLQKFGGHFAPKRVKTGLMCVKWCKMGVKLCKMPSTAQHSPVQPRTDQYGPVHPSNAGYSPIQPTTAQNPPVQPITAHYSPVQPSTAQYNPIQCRTAK